ncbi:MAG TPA: metal ABC transporter permease [Solirubrobacterales bacterium]|nr:metal ABC transporter permease [Solirubrobacterales bacterium]
MGWLIDLLPLSYTNSVVLIGAVILGLTAGVLGSFAVLRERSLVGDALSHAALPGVAVAFIVTGAKDASSLAVGAGIACLAGALLMVAIERTGRIRPDAAIGVVLAGFFSLGIVLLTYLANFNNANQAGLDTYLFGQAAGLLERDLVLMAALCALTVTAVAIAWRPLKTTLFDPAFAGSVGLPVRALEVAMTALLVVAVVVGIRTVGAILMVGLLIVPAVVARQLVGRLPLVLVVAGLVGAAVGATGALISQSAELPTGPVIILVGTAAVIAAVLLAPGRGLAWRWRKLIRDRRRTLVEGTLVDLETALHAGPPPTADELALAGAHSPSAVRRALADLDRAGMLERDGDGRIHLSEAGAAAAHAVLERRDLWSAWLEHGWRLELPDAREPNPADLRASLGDELTDELLTLARAG